MQKAKRRKYKFHRSFPSFTLIDRNLSLSLSLSVCALQSSLLLLLRFVGVSISPQMRRNCFHISLAFLLKLFNFLQAFIGVCIILYSVWMLNQWNHRVPSPPPPLVLPSLDSSSLSRLPNSNSHSLRVLNLVTDVAYGIDDGLGLDFNSFKLPAPWYSYFYYFCSARGVSVFYIFIRVSFEFNWFR